MLAVRWRDCRLLLSICGSCAVRGRLPSAAHHVLHVEAVRTVDGSLVGRGTSTSCTRGASTDTILSLLLLLQVAIELLLLLMGCYIVTWLVFLFTAAGKEWNASLHVLMVGTSS